MTNKSRNKAEKFWDKAAKSYDKEERKDDQIFQQIIERSKAYLKPTDKVLDLGCGTGLVTNKIAPLVDQIHGIDLSAKMIKLAKMKAEKQQINNVEYIHATIFEANLESNSYDVVVASYVMHLLDDPIAVLNKINKLLKPRGIFISITPCMGENKILGFLFSILGKIGIIPSITSYKSMVLEAQLSQASFQILEKIKLTNTSNQYYIIATK